MGACRNTRRPGAPHPPPPGSSAAGGGGAGGGGYFKEGCFQRKEVVGGAALWHVSVLRCCVLPPPLAHCSCCSPPPRVQGTGDWPGTVPPPQVQDKSYAFVEFRSVEEASNAMALDGVLFRENYIKVGGWGQRGGEGGGPAGSPATVSWGEGVCARGAQPGPAPPLLPTPPAPLQIRRPNNYDANMAIMLGPTDPSPALDLGGLEIVRTVVADSPHKLFVGGLPCDWTEEQVKEMLVPFGPLKAFNLVMDRATGNSKVTGGREGGWVDGAPQTLAHCTPLVEPGTGWQAGAGARGGWEVEGGGSCSACGRGTAAAGRQGLLCRGPCPSARAPRRQGHNRWPGTPAPSCPDPALTSPNPALHISFQVSYLLPACRLQGYAFCEYSDVSVTDVVIGQLNSKAIGNKFLTGGCRGVGVGGGRQGPAAGLGLCSLQMDNPFLFSPLPWRLPFRLQ